MNVPRAGEVDKSPNGVTRFCSVIDHPREMDAIPPRASRDPQADATLAPQNEIKERGSTWPAYQS
jgi:hypothetical protein